MACHAELVVSTVSLIALFFFVWAVVILVRARKARAAGETPDPKKVRDAKIVAVMAVLVIGASFAVGMLLLPLL